MTLPGFIAATAACRDKDRRFAARNERRRYDDVVGADLLGHPLALALLFFRGEFLGVAAGGLRVDPEIELEKMRAERHHLFLDDGAYVVAADDGAETARGSDRLESGDAGAQHEHFCRSESFRRPS